jgi:hypothetical protein
MNKKTLGFLVGAIFLQLQLLFVFRALPTKVEQEQQQQIPGLLAAGPEIVPLAVKTVLITNGETTILLDLTTGKWRHANYHNDSGDIFVDAGWSYNPIKINGISVDPDDD